MLHIIMAIGLWPNMKKLTTNDINKPKICVNIFLFPPKYPLKIYPQNTTTQNVSQDFLAVFLN